MRKILFVIGVVSLISLGPLFILPAIKQSYWLIPLPALAYATSFISLLACKSIEGPLWPFARRMLGRNTVRYPWD